MKFESRNRSWRSRSRADAFHLRRAAALRDQLDTYTRHCQIRAFYNVVLIIAFVEILWCDAACLQASLRTTPSPPIDQFTTLMPLNLCLSNSKIQKHDRYESSKTFPKLLHRSNSYDRSVFVQRPFFGVLLFDNTDSDARDHCANERSKSQQARPLPTISRASPFHLIRDTIMDQVPTNQDQKRSSLGSVCRFTWPSSPWPS